MRNENDSTLKQTFLLLVLAITFIIGFVTFAVKKGRLKELLISTPILIGTYFLVYYVIDNSNKYLSITEFLFFFGLPIGIYAIYWICLLSREKITSLKANKNWSNKDWWWSLDGWEFEEEVAKIFRLNGYEAEVTKKTGDGGIDIVMYKEGLKYIVQCKHYRNTLPIEPVRALNGVRQDFKANILIIVASSGLTKAGYEFIENKPYIEVLTLDDLIAMGLRPQQENIIDVECVKEESTLPKFF